ncbi:MAG: ComEC/Rec2 family competence protein [bacterium]
MKIQNKIPILLPLFFLILGITYQENIPGNFYFILIAIIFSFIFALNYKNNIPAYSLVFFSGALLLQNQKNENLDIFKKIENQNINVIASVLNKKNFKKQNIKEELVLKIKTIEKENQLEPINFNLICYTYTPTKILPGQQIKIEDIKINNPNKTGARSDPFSYFLLKEKILSSFFTKKLKYKILKENINPIKQAFYKIKNRIYEKIKLKLSPKAFNYFASIFLGNKTETISSEQRNIFNIWGVSHYLARSGLHIVIFIIIWQLIFNLIPIPIKNKNVMLLIISIIYLALSWTSISFLRAFFVFILYQLSSLWEKQANFLHILTIVCLIILIKNPIQLFFLDFQLTFLLTFALAISNKKIF